MAIEKKLICFARLEEFERQLAAGNILDYSIVFIQDAKKIWTRGTYYDCNNVTPDWNAQEGEDGYIKNKTHYGNFVQYDIPTSINSDTETAISIDMSSAVDNIYVNYRYEQYNINETICLSYTDKEVHTLANGPIFRVRRDGSSIYILGTYDVNQQLFVATELTKLSDVYIPNTIARLADIPKGAYITDFSLNNLSNLYITHGAMQCDLLRLQDELLSNNIVLVPYDNSDGLGYELLTGSVDDFLYFGVHSYVWGETYYVEIQRDSQELTGQDIQVKKDIYKEEVSANYAEKSSFGDMSDVVTADGLYNGNMLYALPTSATGEEDDIIATKNTLKTINGESILGEGDLTIEGGAKVYELNLTGRGASEDYITEEEWNIIKDSDRIKIITDYFSTEIVRFYSPLFETLGDFAVFGSLMGIQGGVSTTYAFSGANTTQGSPYSYTISEVLIPTTTSQLENDSNFVSSDGLKTINGESIVGSGNIVIEGGETLTESDIAAMGFTKNTGTYSKPSGGIPKTDLASAVQTSLGKADTALQSYTEQYKGTVTGVKINGTTKNPSSGVVDLGTVITAHQDISGKQDKLVSGTNIKTVNGQSLLGSGDITISGGTSSGSGSGAYSEVNHGTADITFTLTPNTFHVWEEVASLTLDFGSETSGVANEFLFQFTSGATATSLTLPDDIKWANDSAPTIAENMIYQVSVLKGLASVLEFSNVQLISFILNGTTYSALQDMTWADWCNSSYNTKGAHVSGDFIYAGAGVIIYNNAAVSPSEVIINDRQYIIAV